MYLLNVIFQVPKKDGGCWSLVNVKALKNFVAEEHFQDGLDFHMAKNLVKPANWLQP